MKILIYQPRISYYVGGGEVVPVNQAKLLIEKGHDVIVVTSKADWLEESGMFKDFKKQFPSNIIQIDIPDRIKHIYHEEPGENWSRWDAESIHFGLHAKSIIQKIDYDVAIFHLPLDLIALDQDKRNLGYLHGYPEKIDYLCKILLQNQHDFVAVSDKVKEKWNYLLPGKDIQVVYNGINNQYFCPNDEIEKNIDLLFVGRLIENKGIKNLLLICNKIINLDSSIKIGIVGKGPMSEYVSKYIEDNNLKSNVFQYGYVEDKKLLELYRSSKVCIFPSISKEGLLTTVLEATACGVPVLSAKGLGLEVYIKDGVNGYLFDYEDIDSVVNIFDKIIKDSSKLSDLSKNARRISSNWSWNKKIVDLEKILKKNE